MEKKKLRMTRSLILVACAAVVGVSVYADWNYNRKKDVDTGGYLFNSAVTGENVKILGEATYVGAQDGNAENVSAGSGEADAGYFTSAALERRRSRDESLELLQTVVDSSESMPDAKNKALSDMTAIASAIESETNIETLIKAKGFRSRRKMSKLSKKPNENRKDANNRCFLRRETFPPLFFCPKRERF